MRRLHKTAENLPNGLLQRLVEDAVFFEEWNLKKKRARASSRIKQQDAQQQRGDELYWKAFRKRFR
jgi:hypothetical protein